MSYRALKMEFDLDDDQLEVLKEELLFSQPEIEEIDGRGLVWNGITERTSAPQSVSPESQSPITYTPPHLAERILAEQAAMEARGATDGEIQDALDMGGDTERPRRWELQKAGMIVDSGMRRRTRSMRMARVWRCV